VGGFPWQEQSLQVTREEAIVTRRWSSAALSVFLMGVCAAGAHAQGLGNEPSTQQAKPLPPAEARERNLRAYMEMLRSDIRTEKVAVIKQIMQFTHDEDAAFWPIYREYEVELTRLNDDLLKLIETYANTYDRLTAETANDLVVKSLDLESRRTALKQKYFAKFKTAVTPRTAARFMQVENQIQLLLDLQIAASLPVLQ
jgi:hypothetical protein